MITKITFVINMMMIYNKLYLCSCVRDACASRTCACINTHI